MPDVRVAIYARQSVREDEGIAQQVHHCRVIAEQVHQWNVVGTYTDNDVSASHERDASTAWARMLADFEAGKFDIVMCTEVPRLLRRVVDVVELRNRGIRIVTARDGIDTATPMGNTILTILVALAEAEIETKKARNVPFTQARRAAGHPSAGRVPYGYRWVPKLQRDDEGHRWRVDPEEASVVRRIFAQYLAGTSMRQVALDLNQDGHVTGAGKRWGATTIKRMLTSPFYAALLPPVQGWADFDPSAVDIAQCTPGAWEPLVTREQYLAARARTEQNLTGNNTARRYLLSGLALCGVCHKPVISARIGGTTAAHGYRCSAENGSHFQRRGDVLDDFVSGLAVARLSRPDAADLLKPIKGAPDIAVLRTQRDTLEGRDADIAALIAAGKLTAQAAAAALDDLAAQLRDLNDAIAEAVAIDPLAAAVSASDVAAWWDGATLGQQRAVVDALLVVTINRVGPGRRTNLLNVAETVDIDWR